MLRPFLALHGPGCLVAIMAAYWGHSRHASDGHGRAFNLPRLAGALRPLDHGADTLRGERLAALVAITGGFQPGGDHSVAQTPAFTLCPPHGTALRPHLPPTPG